MQISNELTNQFCMAPWTNIHVGTMENLQPCCAGAGVHFNLNQLQTYLGRSNQDLLSIKKYFSQNQEPPGCRGCQERDWYTQFLNQAPIGVDDFTLLSVDLRWSNTCQLTCMYCGAGNSSAWAALEQTKTTTIPIGHRIRDRQSLIDLIDRHRSTIQRVSLLGGEPLLIKENIKVLELLDPDIEVNIFTGFNIDIDNNPVYKILIGMPNVYWTISMENVGQKFEFVRRGASWTQQVKNINHLLAHNQSRYTVNLQSQFCAYSATSVVELYEYAKDHDIKINWNWLDHPSELDFTYFPDCHKTMALEQLNHAKSLAHKFSYTPQVDHIIDRIHASLGIGDQHQVVKCRQWHRDIEARYFRNRFEFASLWPEFAV